jgi:hypothetical protein
MQIYFVIWEFESDEFSKEPMRISIWSHNQSYSTTYISLRDW